MIPGRGVSNTPEAEAAAAQVSCMKVNRAPMGLQPACWRKIRMCKMIIAVSIFRLLK